MDTGFVGIRDGWLVARQLKSLPKFSANFFEKLIPRHSYARIISLMSDHVSYSGQDSLNTAPGEGSSFEEELRVRYERLSLLTLDLATEAGEAMEGFAGLARHDRNGKLKGFGEQFSRGAASVTRLLWAHSQIERLRIRKPKRYKLPRDRRSYDGIKERAPQQSETLRQGEKCAVPGPHRAAQPSDDFVSDDGGLCKARSMDPHDQSIDPNRGGKDNAARVGAAISEPIALPDLTPMLDLMPMPDTASAPTATYSTTKSATKSATKSMTPRKSENGAGIKGWAKPAGPADGSGGEIPAHQTRTRPYAQKPATRGDPGG